MSVTMLPVMLQVDGWVYNHVRAYVLRILLQENGCLDSVLATLPTAGRGML